MRFVDGMARASEFFCVAVSARVVPSLEIGIDDLVRTGDNRPAWLGLPGGRGHRRSEDLRCRQHLRSRLEFGLLARQISGEVIVEVGGIEKSEAVVGHLHRSFLLRRGAWHALPKGAFVFSDIGSVRGDVDKADDIRVDAGLRDDRAAVAVTYKNARAWLKVEDTLGGSDVVFQ